MSIIQIRNAKISDIQAIQRLHSQVDELHHQAAPNYFRAANEIKRPHSYFENFINDPESLILIAITDGKIIGSLQAEIRETNHPLLNPFKYGQISGIVVDKRWRRQQIGKTLITQAHNWFHKQDIEQIELTVFQFNQEAISFYKSLGYSNQSLTMSLNLNQMKNT